MKLRRTLLLGVLALAATGVAAQSPASARRPLTLAQMEQMFRNLRTKTPLNVDGDLLWGYFFIDPQAEKLKALADELALAGYRFAGLHPAADGRTHVLEVQRIETHTAQTLQERNLEFYRLAEKRRIQAYDGMDVGPVPQLRR